MSTARRKARARQVSTSGVPVDLAAGPCVEVWAPGLSLAEGAIRAYVAYTRARIAWQVDHPEHQLPGRAPYSRGPQ